MSFCNLSINTRFQNKKLYSNDWHFNQKLYQVFLIYILYNVRELLAAIFTNLVIHAQILLLKKCFYSFLRYLKFEMLMDTENRCKVTKAHWVRRVRWAKKKPQYTYTCFFPYKSPFNAIHSNVSTDTCRLFLKKVTCLLIGNT